MKTNFVIGPDGTAFVRACDVFDVDTPIQVVMVAGYDGTPIQIWKGDEMPWMRADDAIKWLRKEAASTGNKRWTTCADNLQAAVDEGLPDGSS